eukprot:16446467-Heterocapsa_arctica.AAC.1
METEAEEPVAAPMVVDPAERRRRLQDDVPESIKKARAEQLALLPAPVVLPVPPVPAAADEPAAARKTHRAGRRNNPMQNITLGEGAADPTAAPAVLTGPALRAHLQDDVPFGMKRGGVTIPSLKGPELRKHLLDDVPVSILRKQVESAQKKPKTALAACPVLVEAFVTERAWEPKKQEFKKTAKGKELNLKEVRDWDKMKASLLKEWATWSKYAAVDVIPAA